LMDFHEKHKDFPLEATFFLNGEHPFRQNSLISEKLSFIVENGMDIGNHTKDHNSFKNMGAEEIQEQIGWEVQFLKKALNKDDYEITTLALPFGERPKDEELKKYLASGSCNDISYENIAVLNVGWNPAYSPYDKRFDRISIPRIRASEMKVDNVGLYNYIVYFDNHPEERFISDGVPEIITIPDDKNELIDIPADKEIYTYEKK
ncbi:MAG: polysaccharide deacetylase family protein, partial [Bacillota bacterium]